MCVYISGQECVGQWRRWDFTEGGGGSSISKYPHVKHTWKNCRPRPLNHFVAHAHGGALGDSDTVEIHAASKH